VIDLGYHWMLGEAVSFGLFGGYADSTENYNTG
jgi:hypothetical protein